MKYPIEIFKKSSQKTLYILIFLTNQCNYNCWYCYNNKKTVIQYIDCNQIIQFLINLRTKYEHHFDINFIGGEPTQYTKLYDILYLCKKHLTNYTLYIITNLSKPKEYFNKFNSFNYKLTASYHSQYNFNQFYNTVKDLANTQNIIKDIIVMCNPYKFNKSIYAYIKLNQLKLQTKYSFKVELNVVDNFKYNFIQSNFIKNYIKNKKEYTVVYSDNTIETKSFSDIANNNNFKFKMWQCNAGKDIIYIHSNGNIYPCESWFNEKYKPIGNIYDQNFSLSSLPIICKCNFCSGDFNIFKKRIFKIF